MARAWPAGLGVSGRSPVAGAVVPEAACGEPDDVRVGRDLGDWATGRLGLSSGRPGWRRARWPGPGSRRRGRAGAGAAAGPGSRCWRAGREMATRTRASRCHQPGATLGATGMNNLPVLRTRLDNRKRRAGGRELSRTGPDAGTGIYGSEGWGRNEEAADPEGRRQGVRSACDSERLTAVTHGQSCRWCRSGESRQHAGGSGGCLPPNAPHAAAPFAADPCFWPSWVNAQDLRGS
jgi:hypothetical protein